MKKSVEADMIGCLCWFNNYREIVVGILKEIQTSPNGENYYLDDNGYFYPECQPVKPDEIKFYGLKLNGLENENKKLKEELKELKKMSENEELRKKIHILNEANMRLENENGELCKKIRTIEKGILTEKQREKLISTFKKSCISAWTSTTFQIPAKSRAEAETFWIEIAVLLNSALDEMENKKIVRHKR